MTKPPTSKEELRAAMRKTAEGIDRFRAHFPNAKVIYAKEGREVGKKMDLSKSITLAERK